MPAKQPARTPSGDTTGRQTQRMIKQNSAELAERATELSMTIQADKLAAQNEVFDPAVYPDLSPEPVVDLTAAALQAQAVTEVPIEPVVVDEYIVIRMAETITDMVYGDPYQKYTLEAGKQYRVRRDMGLHLIRLGATFNQPI